MARAKTDVHTFTAAGQTWEFEDGGRHANIRLWMDWTGTVGTETLAVVQLPGPDDPNTFTVTGSPFSPPDSTAVIGTGLIHRLDFTTGGVWAAGATLRLRMSAWNEGQEMAFDTGTRPTVP